MLEKLWNEHIAHRNMVFQQLQSISTPDLRKRKVKDKWSVEELLRHILRADEWWFYIFLLEIPNPQFHTLGIKKKTQALKWASLPEIKNSISEFDIKFIKYLEDHPNIDELFDRPKFDMKVPLRWVFYHLMQHELETFRAKRNRQTRSTHDRNCGRCELQRYYSLT